jgi:hypothetical protein
MDSLAELFSFSLAKRKASEDAFWIHPVVHNWACERLDSQIMQKKAEEAVIVCGRLFMQDNDKQPCDWVFERPHILSVQKSLKAHPNPSNTLIFANGEHLFEEASNMGQLALGTGQRGRGRGIPRGDNLKGAEAFRRNGTSSGCCCCCAKSAVCLLPLTLRPLSAFHTVPELASTRAGMW